jgi:hypothetical protein
MTAGHSSEPALVAGSDPAEPAPKVPLEREWARWPWQSCRAYRERHQDDPYFGRCELIRNHRGDHALERGFDIPRWSTRWTA